MRNLLGIIIATLCLLALPPQAHALWGIGDTAKSETKERLVLMPLRVGDADKSRQNAMETALIEGLQQKYEVFSGEQVAKKAREIFMKESRNAAKRECDETRCMQGIAEAFQAELIATANVSKQQDGYFLALSIQNIFDNKVVYSKSVPCQNCNAYQVIDKLKELSGASVPASAPAASPAARNSATPAASGKAADPETAFWEAVQKGNSADDYGVYLAKYPRGQYVELARSRIKNLQEQTASKTTQQDQSAWDKADKTATEASYQSYLKTYPQGQYAALATARIAKLKKAPPPTAASAPQTEKAQGPVMVRIPGKNYEIGKYEVTQAQWKAVMGSNPSHFSNCGSSCPVEQVSWDDVQIFLKKLNARTGKQYRLPSEAEWEYACYGGNQTEYCGGNDIDSVAWYRKGQPGSNGGLAALIKGQMGQPGGNSNQTTHPVGKKQANGYGLYDMSGNVCEWTSDCREGNCALRVLRGGSWNFGPIDARSASRDLYVAPANRFDFGGFRVVRTLP